MSEDRTRDLSDKRSFEERVFARFDGMDARFDAMDTRFDGLDSRVQALEARALDTKPIWERALAEILEVKQGVGEVKERVENVERKFNVLIQDMMQLRGDQSRVESQFDALKSKLA
jgi:chromosome segregation ATPase